MPIYTLIGPIRQLLTMRGLEAKGPLQDSQLEIITEAGIFLKDEKIHEIGSYWDIYPEAQSIGAKMETLQGDFVALPGFVDCHTHICFAGSRAKDFAMRNTGKSYLEIANAGGGIWDTVTQTRKAILEQLVKLTVKRANSHLTDGVTTTEVKSGYGLSVAEEIKIKQTNAFTFEDVKKHQAAIKAKATFICVSASGGARMQEGLLSLMQMAKTSAKLTQLADAGLPYISLLTDPTTGGVTASYAMLGDINIAEPGALIGFAGPRVIKETIKKDLPPGFQRSEFLLEHGFLDFIVDRKELKQKLSEVAFMFRS